MAIIELGDYKIEYEFIPGEPMTRDHPGAPDDVEILAVTVGLHTFDEPAEVFSEKRLDRWAEDILEHEADLARKAREELLADADDAAREARFHESINERFGVFHL